MPITEKGMRIYRNLCEISMRQPPAGPVRLRRNAASPHLIMLLEA